MSKPRTLIVTSALPYANGAIHLGHMLEHIQTDIWVRFQKMRAHRCFYVCADDTHGTAIMLAAEKKGVTPKALIDQVHAEHLADFKGFLIDYDEYYSTDSPENKALAETIYQTLCTKNKIVSRQIVQLYDPEKNLFLPDRFVKGGCPKCAAPDQYGDYCEACGSTYLATELKNPYSAVSGATPILRHSEHYFFRLSECTEFLKEWTTGTSQSSNGSPCLHPHLQSEALNKMNEWIACGLQDWDVSRDAPYFGFEIPGAPGKYFYVWLDAPVGYLASFKHLAQRKALDFDTFFAPDSPTELYHFIGKDILYFHALFWPAILHYAGLLTPTGIFVHGFVTVNGQKMSKSRGTFLTARSFLDCGLEPELLRYYFAAKLNSRSEDIDLSLDDFVARVNADLIGKFINIAARMAAFIHRHFNGRLAVSLAHESLLQTICAVKEDIAQAYEGREYSRALREIMLLADAVNAYIDAKKPWLLAHQADKALELQQVCSVALNAFRVLMVYLKPVLPRIAQQVEAFLNIPPLTWRCVDTHLTDHEIRPYQRLMDRIKPESITALLAANQQTLQSPNPPATE